MGRRTALHPSTISHRFCIPCIRLPAPIIFLPASVGDGNGVCIGIGSCLANRAELLSPSLFSGLLVLVSRLFSQIVSHSFPHLSALASAAVAAAEASSANRCCRFLQKRWGKKWLQVQSRKRSAAACEAGEEGPERRSFLICASQPSSERSAIEATRREERMGGGSEGET